MLNLLCSPMSLGTFLATSNDVNHTWATPWPTSGLLFATLSGQSSIDVAQVPSGGAGLFLTVVQGEVQVCLATGEVFYSASGKIDVGKMKWVPTTLTPGHILYVMLNTFGSDDSSTDCTSQIHSAWDCIHQSGFPACPPCHGWFLHFSDYVVVIGGLSQGASGPTSLSESS